MSDRVSELEEISAELDAVARLVYSNGLRIDEEGAQSREAETALFLERSIKAIADRIRDTYNELRQA